MKILLMSIGTRGDIEPFLAIGEILSKKEHKLTYAIPEQYSHLIPNKDKYHSFTPEFLALIEGEGGRAVMGGSVGFIKKIKSILRLYKKGMAVNKIMIIQQYDIVKNEEPDLIIYNGKCNYPLLWHLSTGKKIVLISPIPYFIHYIEGNGHTGFDGNYGSFINRLTYKIANFGLVKTIYDAQKILGTKDILFSKKQIKEKLLSEKLIYTLSPSLLIRPMTWSSNVQVLGYHERNKKLDWQPDENLIEFIGKHQKILFLTFGSMINPDPEKTAQKFLSVLSELKIPTIINTAAGGIIQLKEFEEHNLFYFIKQIPYDWILEKCYGIIHHGGSGTTHSGLKNGCVTMIIPHVFDQYGWNNLIFKAGLGPKGISVNKISEKKLKPQIIDLFENESYKIKAVEISKKMKEENFENELYESIMR
ncbi:glycosyltransferase [Flavobacterium piscis]|uniref:UDP:flavonoid glycosyltransferase YjiC (YdhE family) n=1 Tax=Flavobacterium piscis TaxID=1114874 RepID=A0ABU1Y9V1_9FLAO|nr:glycosyltransferase [Flavobacterium piscis]MDR7210984.1 UDP:flavonoid glycosyltransferase YjiC (YdhE family) [Flavobacterium piscis]